MDQILAKVVSMENAGYQFEAADGSFDLLVQRCMGTFRPHFERLHYRRERRQQGGRRSHGPKPR